MGRRLTGRNPGAYRGVEPSSPPNSLWIDRAPLISDYAEYNIGDFWLYKNTNRIFVLIDKKYFIATWLELGAGAGGGIQTLTGNTGGAVSGDLAFNINTVGQGILTNAGNPGDNSLTMGFTAATNGQVIIGRTGLQPVWSHITTTTLDIVEGSGTLSIDLADTYIKQIDVPGSLLPNAGGIVNFESPDGSVVFAVVGNTLQITAPGGGGGTGTVTQVLPGDNINITGTPTVQPVVNLDMSILQPQTNADGSEGVYALGTTDYETDRFLHAAGDISNTFVGYQSGNFATITGAAEDNTGAGNLTLSGLVSGGENSAFGAGALDTITTGNRNSAFGRFAGSSLTLGDSDNILIGHFGTAGDNHRIRIGRQGTGNFQQDSTFIVGIYAQTPPTLTPRVVTVNSAHQLQAVGSAADGTVLTLVAGIPAWQPAIGGGTVTSVNPGVNINMTGGILTPNPTVNLNSSVQQPVTNNTGTQGVYALGATALPGGYVTDRFMHAYGTNNSFLGASAGNMTLTGSNSTGLGYNSLNLLSTGVRNTAAGAQSLQRILTGGNNTVLGYQAGFAYTGSESSNITIGSSVVGSAGDNNTLRIGQSGAGTGQQAQAFIGGIYPNASSGSYRVTTTNSTDKVQTLANGTEGYVLTINTGVPQWRPAGGGGGGGIIITTFTTNGTWIKNVDTKLVTVIGWNGGSGGGSGSRQSGNLTDGGQGGGAGGSFFLTMPAFMFDTSEPVVVGTGGAGGPGSNATNGNDGDEGTNTTIGFIGCPTPSQDKGQTGTPVSGGGAGANNDGSSVVRHGLGSPIITESFGNYYQGNQTAGSYSGSVGFGGGAQTNTGTQDLLGQASGINNAVGNSQPIPGQATRNYAMLSATGGGGGSMRGDTPTFIRGGQGGNAINSAFYNVITQVQFIVLAGGAGGILSGSNGADGNDSITVPANPDGSFMGGFLVGGTGGGGGAFGNGVNGGAGGDGGFPGGGGGGGGGCTSPRTSGAGGIGADGYLIVIEYL